MKHLFLLIPTLAALTVAGCSTPDWFSGSEKKKLEGERLSLYDFEKTLRSDPNTQFGLDGSEEQTLITLPESLAGGEDTGISLDSAWDNTFWPQAGGYPNHAMKHVALTNAAPKNIWSRSIGKGATNTTPMTAAPIVADNKVFTLDTNCLVTATDATTGKMLWKQNVLKPNEDESVIGGGLAFSGNRVFVTNGFNEILALNPDNGKILWRTATKAPIRGAPSAVPGRVFAITMNNKTIAMDAATGNILWQHNGLDGESGILGASTPAIDKNAVITAYSSGEVYALRIENGQELWAENLSPVARAAGRMKMTDIRALPVIDSGVVYATSHANRIAAIDMRTGLAQWNAAIGSTATPWVSGNRLYILSLQGTLISMDRANGAVLWQVVLDRYEDPKDREGLISWQGPVLAGNRLMVMGSNGQVQSYNPVDGTKVGDWSVGRKISLPPAIAKGVLYIVDDNGNLSAWK